MNLGSLRAVVSVASAPALRRLLVLTAVAVLLVPGVALAAPLENPVRDASAITDPHLAAGHRTATAEAVRRVPGARIVTANYDLIRRDFKATRKMSTEQIDGWLVSHTGYMADSQVRLGADASRGAPTNTPIHADEPQHKDRAVRPASYGRALVFKVPGGLIDAKGMGALKPGQGEHSNGLNELGEMIREFAFHQAVDAVLDHADVGIGTVGAYAVIDWGFDVKYEDGRTAPAGAILRQAHNRYQQNRGSTKNSSIVGDEKAALSMERVLRRYGITSAGAYRAEQDTDLVNIQMDRDGAHILDFGAFKVLPRFPRRPMAIIGGSPAFMSAKATDYPDADDAFVLDQGDWGVREETYFSDHIGDVGNELAWGLREGRISRAEIDGRLGGILGRVKQRLASAPASPDKGTKIVVRSEATLRPRGGYPPLRSVSGKGKSGSSWGRDPRLSKGAQASALDGVRTAQKTFDRPATLDDKKRATPGASGKLTATSWSTAGGGRVTLKNASGKDMAFSIPGLHTKRGKPAGGRATPTARVTPPAR